MCIPYLIYIIYTTIIYNCISGLVGVSDIGLVELGCFFAGYIIGLKIICRCDHIYYVYSNGNLSLKPWITLHERYFEGILEPFGYK